MNADPQVFRKRVTLFQRKVYEAVIKIPKGQTRTYAQIARTIGKPKAARAVGQALKRNRWAPTIPCHRVVASNGKLGGYSAQGGIPAKRRLLRREGAALAAFRGFLKGMKISFVREKRDRIG